MNIWTLRKKLNQSSNHQPQVAPQPVQIVQPLAVAPATPAALPSASLGLNALLELDDAELCAAPAPAAAPKPSAPLGLNDLFELEDTEIRAISPRLTFSTLKKPTQKM